MKCWPLSEPLSTFYVSVHFNPEAQRVEASQRSGGI